MNETENMVKDFLGEDVFFEFQIRFGGLSLYIGRPDAEAVKHYRDKGLTERQIAMKLNTTESYVYNTIKRIRKQRIEDRQQGLFEE